ncbi:MAG: GIY-YIG nuclease family protein [Ferruginibacter sp.]
MPHFIYILKSLKDHKYYIGESANVTARLKFHNAGKQRSTKSRMPFVLILTEEFQDKEQALRREKQIKSWKGGSPFKKLLEGR